MWRSLRAFSTAKDENIGLIRRELVADAFQNSLKTAAYWLTGAQAMKAELMRSLLDTSNHVILYLANKWSRQRPDERFNYGKSTTQAIASSRTWL